MGHVQGGGPKLENSHCKSQGWSKCFRISITAGVVRVDNSIIRFKTFCLHCTTPHTRHVHSRWGGINHAGSSNQDTQGAFEPEEIWIKLPSKLGRSHGQLFRWFPGFSSEYQTAASCAQNSLELFPAGDQSNLQGWSWSSAAMPGTAAPNRERKENDFRGLSCWPTILFRYKNSKHWRWAVESLFHTSHSSFS